MKKIFGLTSLWFALTAAFNVHAVDFTVSISEVSSANSNGQITFIASIGNASADAYTGPVSMRPFLIPAAFDADGNPFGRTVLLDSQAFNVNLAANGSQTVTFTGRLPLVPRNHYLLGAVINSKVDVTEAQHLNNVTEDLVDVGEVVQAGTDPIERDSDLYMDVPFISVRSGVASAPWRLFKRGNFGASGFYNLFFVVSPQRRKMYVSTYEKSASWVNMGQDMDSRGRTIPYDRYGNPAGINHLPSGDYALLTLVDSREIVSEQDRSNNLDMRRFQASRFQPVNAMDTWFTFAPGAATSVTRTININNNFAGTGTWTIDPKSVPGNVQIAPMTGAFAGNTSQFPIQVVVNGKGLGSEIQEFAIRVNVQQGVSETISVPFSVSSFVEQQPAVRLEMPATLSARKTAVARGALRITNTGTEMQRILLSTNSTWIYFAGTGVVTVNPGETQSVAFVADSRTLTPGAATATIQLNSNAVATPVTGTLTFNVSASESE